MYSDALEYLTTEHYGIMTFLVFSTSSNTVDIKILKRKLQTEYGVGEVALNWFKSYFSIRTNKVKHNETLSDA